MNKEQAVTRLRIVDEFLITCLTAGWLIRWMKSCEISEALTERYQLKAIIKNFEALDGSSATPSGHDGGSGSGAGSEGV